jgi:fatty acid desaturase
MSYLGTGWIPFAVSVFLNAAVQAQAGWNQHDYGHLSVFKTSFLNHVVHYYIMNFTKGASRSWWNHLHYQHHAKPNMLHKDPDVRLDAVFVLGEEMPKRVAKKKKTMPYNWQHRYFFIIGPPLLFPIYFQYMIFKHPYVRRQWMDLLVMSLFYIKFFSLYIPMLGVGWTLLYYFLVRCVESHWFVWVSQSNHIPMEIDDDKARPWLPLQLHATCNVEKSFFNDWFTGHLNFQVEHHLFPTMPRHNLYKIAPLVKSLCQKHDVPYVVKPLGTAFSDIVGSLKHSGEIWHAYYHAYHLS